MQQAHFIAGTLTSLDDYTFNKYMITSAKEDMFLPWLFVCLLATLHKKFQTDLHEIFREGWQWAKE